MWGEFLSRLVWVDNLRGFLALSVVIMHMIEWILGLDTVVCRLLYFSLNSFIMPGFFVMSGYLYSRNYKEKKNKGRYLVDRSVELLIPMIVCGILIIIINAVIGQSFLSILKGPLWFIPALIVSTIVYSAFYKMLVSDINSLIILLLLWLVSGLFNNSISKSFGYISLFTFGAVYRDYESTLLKCKKMLLLAISICIIESICIYHYMGYDANLNNFIKITLGLPISYVLLQLFGSIPMMGSDIGFVTKAGGGILYKYIYYT